MQVFQLLQYFVGLMLLQSLEQVDGLIIVGLANHETQAFRDGSNGSLPLGLGLQGGLPHDIIGVLLGNLVAINGDLGSALV